MAEVLVEGLACGDGLPTHYNREVPGEASSKKPDSLKKTARTAALWLTGWVGSLVIRMLGSTLRYSGSIEDDLPPIFAGEPAIYCFWHRCLIPALYEYRDCGIAVMTSRSGDGEYIARILERLGFRAVRGSSSRGGAMALRGMSRELEAAHSVAFTIDGPRGPRDVAKPGPLLLASRTQLPIYCFHIALKNPWTLNTWDGFMIPRPFSRVVVQAGKAIRVPRDVNDKALQSLHVELQETMDRVREKAEQRFFSDPRQSGDLKPRPRKGLRPR